MFKLKLLVILIKQYASMRASMCLICGPILVSSVPRSRIVLFFGSLLRAISLAGVELRYPATDFDSTRLLRNGAEKATRRR